MGLYVQSGYVQVTMVDWGSTTSIDSSAVSLQKANILSAIQTQLQPTAIAYDPDNGMIYVSTSNGSKGTIDVISASNNSVVTSIQFPERNPSVMVFDDNYSNLYAYDSSGGDHIYVINTGTNEITSNISTGAKGTIGGAAFDPVNKDLYIAGGTTNSLIVISTATGKVLQTVGIQGNPTFVTYSPSNGYIYVETAESNQSSTITIISPLALIPAVSNTIVSTIRLPASGVGICYVPLTGGVYALTNYPAAISEISSQTGKPSSSVFLSSSVSLGAASGVVYDQLNKILIITTGNDSVIEFSPLLNSVRVGLELPPLSGAVAINTANGNIYAPSHSLSEVLEFSP